MRTLRDINSHILDMSKSTWVDASGAEKTFDAKTWKDDIKGLVSGAATLKTKKYIKPDAGPDYYIWWVRYDPRGIGSSRRQGLRCLLRWSALIETHIGPKDLNQMLVGTLCLAIWF